MKKDPVSPQYAFLIDKARELGAKDAKKVTGTDCVHAVLGGFHLSGKTYEQVVPPTIEAMKKINPEYLVPMHCTGWSTINRFMEALPGKCILNTVGTTYVF